MAKSESEEVQNVKDKFNFDWVSFLASTLCGKCSVDHTKTLFWRLEQKYLEAITRATIDPVSGSLRPG